MATESPSQRRVRRRRPALWFAWLVPFVSVLVSWTDRAPPPRADSVIVIALDGVRWQEIFVGCASELTQSGRCPSSVPAPVLRRLFTTEGAALGAPGRSQFGVAGPTYLSMPGYQQMFTGLRHVECASNECGRVRHPTIVEAVAKRFGAEEAVVISSWAGIGEAAARVPSSVRISAGGGGAGTYREDRETAQQALELAERELPRFLFVGLGDTDEAAHTGDYDAYLAALQRADRWIGRFVELARRRNAEGRATTLLVTTDHGRALDAKEHERVPEAAQIWLLASGPEIRARGLVEARRRELADVAPTVARLLGVPFPGAEGSVIDELFQGGDARPVAITLAFGGP